MNIHLIANAHLDPVWLWDWREGLTEGLITVRSVLNLMDEDPDLTFIRGEAAIYEHIERHDPALFARIADHVRTGRWDVVGGTYIQPDTNLPSAEVLARHFTRGQNYFQSRFGRTVKAAWQADSFGHSAGLPEILAAAGLEYFAFTRPDKDALPLSEPAFWWQGAGGSRILSYRPLVGWYGCERDEVHRRLDQTVATAAQSGLQTVGFFYGLGNHGGGPSRRQLADIRSWAAQHPECNLIFSGLHRFFADLDAEISQPGGPEIPTHAGELNFCLRGCYSAVAKFKYLYRRSQSLLARAERTDAVAATLVGRPCADLAAAWDGVLFNSFHDILPGSSIERAMDDQIASLGGVIHTGQQVELTALTELAARVDTTVRPPPEDHPSGMAVLVWNPHPQPYQGHVEIEGSLDYRPIHQYTDRPAEVPLRLLDDHGQAMPFQVIRTEHSSLPQYAWRKRILAPLTLPAFGWSLLEFGWVEGASIPPVANPVLSGPTWIDNGLYRVETAVGAPEIQIFHRGRPIFATGGLGAVVYEDPWGSWGGMLEEPESFLLTEVREKWSVTAVELLEHGPERATLWIRLAGAKSRLDLSFSLCRDREVVDVAARVFWDERSARLKLIFPVGDVAEFDVPGATVRRGPLGEVPGGRWVRVPGESGGFGFASDALYNFDCAEGALRATVVRASRYANDVKTGPEEEPWRPAVDAGELTFRFLLTPAAADLSKLADELEQPPLVLLVPATPGTLPRRGSLASLAPAELALLALKPAEDKDGFILRVQAPVGKTCAAAALQWFGEAIPLGEVAGGQIASWRLTRREAEWVAQRTDVTELA